MSQAPPSRPSRLGGQAVIEGVMVRADHRWVVAVRQPDGSIALQRGQVPAWPLAFRKVPVVRGAIALVATVSLGLRALSWSQAVSSGEDEKPSSKGSILAATVLSLAIFIGIFAAGPAAVARAVVGHGGVAFAAVEATIRIVLFLGYVVAIGRVAGVRRTFEYHGAEHQAIAAFEAGARLDLPTVKRFSPRHARCGTDFLVLVAVVAIIVFAFVSPHSWWALLATRVLLLPLVAGLSYELLRLADRGPARRFLAPLLALGLAVQHLTTRTPTDDQIEVAIAAVETALEPAGVPESS